MDDRGRKVIAVDFDKTLAHYNGEGHDFYGPPTGLVEDVKAALAAGHQVKIFTARMSHDNADEAREKFGDWSEKHVGRRLDATHEKTSDIDEIWDDKAKEVLPNTGCFRNDHPLGIARRGGHAGYGR